MNKTDILNTLKPLTLSKYFKNEGNSSEVYTAVKSIVKKLESDFLHKKKEKEI